MQLRMCIWTKYTLRLKHFDQVIFIARQRSNECSSQHVKPNWIESMRPTEMRPNTKAENVPIKRSEMRPKHKKIIVNYSYRSLNGIAWACRD